MLKSLLSCFTGFSLLFLSAHQTLQAAFLEEFPPASLFGLARAAYPDEVRPLGGGGETHQYREEMFFQALSYLREELKPAKTCFISHAYNPKCSDKEEEGQVYKAQATVFDYQDAFYQFLDKALAGFLGTEVRAALKEEELQDFPWTFYSLKSDPAYSLISPQAVVVEMRDSIGEEYGGRDSPVPIPAKVMGAGLA